MHTESENERLSPIWAYPHGQTDGRTDGHTQKNKEIHTNTHTQTHTQIFSVNAVAVVIQKNKSFQCIVDENQ